MSIRRRIAGLGRIHTVFYAACIGLALCAATTSAGAAVPVLDPCTGVSRCFNAGTFVAEVIQVSPSAVGKGVRHQVLTLTMRFRNISDQPLILAYRSKSSAGVDNFGNRYFWGRASTHDTSVKGIGSVDGRSADPQFKLAPGQARNASFAVVRYDARPPLGTAYNYEVVIDELELLPGQQVRSIRENSLSFANLSSNLPGAAAAASGEPTVLDVAAAVRGLLDKNNKQ